MNQKKGFSLSEVLLSLALLTTLALALLQQQWQSRQLFNQLLLRDQASQSFDQIEESSLAHMKKSLAIPQKPNLSRTEYRTF